MLTLLLGSDWISNRDALMNMIASDVKLEKGNRILIVPELISYDTERRLCEAAGDTTSRFAEVLSFTRLYRRVSDAAGHGAAECLDNGGRITAMASATRQLHSKLKAYASVETRPEFLSALLDAIDDFKRCCISSQDLLDASKLTEGAFAQKLEELSLILDTYDSICAQGKRDPSDQMTWLLEQLEDCTYAKEHVFYIDGFPDFTRQHMAILEHLISNSSSVVVCMNTDCLDSALPAFEKAGSTAGALYRFAKHTHVPVRIIQIPSREGPLRLVRDKLFHGETKPCDEISRCLQVQQFRSVYEESLAAAECISALVRKGARYRDIGVVCSDMNVYQNTVSTVFERCKIPMYQSGTEDILEKPVITTVLAAMEAALNGFEQRDVIRYLKSMLSPLSVSVCDRMENYAIMWNITGKRWQTAFTGNPEGLGSEWSQSSELALAELNAARERVITPLIRLHNGFQNAVNVAQQVAALYAFFDDIQLSQRLAELADMFTAVADHRNAQILNQLWEILLSALEQLHGILGNTAWDAEAFTRLFKLLLSQYDVGTIPPVLDSVMVGPVSAMRCQQVKHLIVLGAQEGALPGYSGAKGILTDQERVALRQLGVPLSGGSLDGVQAEFAEIYGVFCGAEESASVFCSAGQPSFIFRRLLNLVDSQSAIDINLTAAKADALEAGAYLARFCAEDMAAALGLAEDYRRIEENRTHKLGSISKENIKKLYGNSLNLSASQIDKQADCRLAYFLRYGLYAKERKPITVDPAEFGTYVHAVLEKTAREIMGLGGFKNVTLEQTLKIAEKHSLAYIQERFSQIDSQRLTYLFRRNADELNMVVKELWDEMQHTEFIPVDFEVAFGDHRQMDAISISGKSMNASVRGFVDRVDVWRDHENNYFRVVDYKTGRKDFDYCDVYNGYGLQMLLYMFALEDGGTDLIGQKPIPAGVQYFPARMPLLPADTLLTDEDAAFAREKMMKRRGLLLSDEDVLTAMENTDNPVKLNIKRKKDGTISGDLASREQMKLLKRYVFSLVGKMVDDIASGCVDANPYTRGSSHNACSYCPYGAVCHPDTVEGRRDYKAMTSQRFWEEVEKEMMKRG